MAEHNENQIFKEMADRYVEHYGEMLKNEAALLNQHPGVTPRMDSKVRRSTRSGAVGRYATGLVALAATIVLVLMIPALMNQDHSGLVSSGNSAASSSAPTQEAEASSPPEIIPISFSLPDNLSVADLKLDNGKSVYYLTNSELDDIVMTMEMNPKEDVFAGLKEIRINDSTAYYKYTADYSVMAFQQREITFILTCKYDVNTLIPLAEAIL